MSTNQDKNQPNDLALRQQIHSATIQLISIKNQAQYADTDINPVTYQATLSLLMDLLKLGDITRLPLDKEPLEQLDKYRAGQELLTDDQLHECAEKLLDSVQRMRLGINLPTPIAEPQEV